MANNRLEQLLSEYKEYVVADFIPSPSRVRNLNANRKIADNYKYSQKVIKEEFAGLMELCVCILSKPTISKELFDAFLSVLEDAENVVLRLNNDKLTYDCLGMVKITIEEIRTNLKRNSIQAKKKVRDINLLNDKVFSKINALNKKINEEVNEG